MWTRRVAALPAPERVKAVSDELRRRNADFGGRHSCRAQEGRVTELSFSSVGVKDLSPVAALAHLEKLSCPAAFGQPGRVADLSPPKGLKLKLLDPGFNPGVEDLGPLKGMPLEHLSLHGATVKDLTPLAGMRLWRLSIGGAGMTAGPAPLRGMPLTYLNLNDSPIGPPFPAAR